MAFTSKLQTLYSAMNLLGILHLLYFWPCESTTSSGFTTDFIHRDYSPLSPFYNSSSTHFDRFYEALQRSQKRINRFKSSLAFTSKIDAPIATNEGLYLMKMSLGTPPVEIVGVVDTGSGLIWTQCQPCIQCYKQTFPIFDPSHSSSYQIVPFQNDSCTALGELSFRNDNTCGYTYFYGNGDPTTRGVLATETVTLGSDDNLVSFPHIAFGCSNNNTGEFAEVGSGIIGLDRSELSLISQLGIGKKFSYCLAPTSTSFTSKISFGSDFVACSNGGKIVTTPIITKSGYEHYYFSINGFSVGNQTVPFADDVGGNIIIDSGTTATYLPSKVFDDLGSALDKVLGAERVKDPSGVLSLCYKDDDHNIQLPNITTHIIGGDLILQPFNTFFWVTDDVFCLVVLSADDDIPIYGSYAQFNFKVGYDLEVGTLNFQSTDCK